MDYSKRISSIRDMPDCPEGLKNVKFPDWYIETKNESIKKLECIMCGNKITRHTYLYCSEECKQLKHEITKSPSVNNLRSALHKWFKFKCQKCGKIFYHLTDNRVLLPRYIGEIHHIIPLDKKYGGKNEFNNLTLLCKKCHLKAHEILRRKLKRGHK